MIQKTTVLLKNVGMMSIWLKLIKREIIHPAMELLIVCCNKLSEKHYSDINFCPKGSDKINCSCSPTSVGLVAVLIASLIACY